MSLVAKGDVPIKPRVETTNHDVRRAGIDLNLAPAGASPPSGPANVTSSCLVADYSRQQLSQVRNVGLPPLEFAPRLSMASNY